MKGYPKWFSKTFIVFITSLVFISGCLLIPSLLEMRLQWQGVWSPLADQRTFVVATHTLSGIAIMAVLGALWSIHMRSGWRAKEKRFSGSVSVLVFVLLTVSSIGVLYAGREEVSLSSSIIHTVAGILILPFFLLHLSRKKV